MSYKQFSPRFVEEGGTENTTFTPYSVLMGGPAGIDPLQQAAPGAIGNILISQGPGSPAVFGTPPIPQMKFQLLASDPVSPQDGQVWYRTDLDEYRGSIINMVNAWTPMNNMLTAQTEVAGVGITSDSLAFGGNGPQATTERWDGVNWTAKTSMNTARAGLAGGGESADALSFGGTSGSPTGATELYAGIADTWTAKTSMNTARFYLAGAGAAASDALSFGGYNGSADVATTEQYSRGGDTWTNKNNLNTARRALAGAGTAADALSFGGVTVATTERWDGTNWTSKANMNTARYGLAGSGSAGDALSFGGTTGSESAVTENYNGVANSWTTVSPLNTARSFLAGSGSSTSALSFGATVTTEEYSVSPSATVYIFDVT